MRNYEEEIAKQVDFIQNALRNAHADGVVFGNSGGKDSALVGILCKKAVDSVVGVIMPCHSKRNYGEDTDDAVKLAEQFGIDTVTVDVSEAKDMLLNAISPVCELSPMAGNNINPRLRMTVLYAIGQSKNYLVAGTGNRSERTMGYFTKYGDGGYDLNPIADLTATEVLEFLRYLNAPEHIVVKAPSAGLFDGQTDEQEMGILYADLDRFILTGEGSEETRSKVQSVYMRTQHKRELPLNYGL